MDLRIKQILDHGNCDFARNRGKEAYVKDVSPRTETWYKADGMSVSEFPAFSRVHLPRIIEQIREGGYAPAPVKRVWIPKPDGSTEKTLKGVPQGGPLSPLLANIMLDPLDKTIEAMGLPFARYADDFLIVTRTKAEALEVMENVPEQSGQYCPEQYLSGESRSSLHAGTLGAL